MTKSIDLVKTLSYLGVSEAQAQELLSNIDGNDYMKLVDAVNEPKGSIKGKEEAARILRKYGIKLENMPVKNNYLDAKYESLKTGQSLDETFGVMTPLSENFSYSVEVTEQTRDKVLDWLDENSVSYQAITPVSYKIECVDRENAYKAGRAISKILGKNVVRDSVEIDEAKKKKGVDARVRDAKEKMASIAPVNPHKVIGRSGSGVHDDGKNPRKVDKMGRGAKYKAKYDEAVVSQETPNDIVSENREDRLDEGVIGMTKMNPLFRLRELAGLPIKNEDGIEVADAPEIDPQGILAPGPVGVEPETVEPTDMTMDEPVDMTVDMGDDIADDAGIPGALGTDPVEEIPDLDTPESDPLANGVGMNSMQSEAMASIEDALNLIQSGLADIKLAEYKSLIQKLQDLTNQVQMMGRDYLGERRKK